MLEAFKRDDIKKTLADKFQLRLGAVPSLHHHRHFVVTVMRRRNLKVLPSSLKTSYTLLRHDKTDISYRVEIYKKKMKNRFTCMFAVWEYEEDIG